MSRLLAVTGFLLSCLAFAVWWLTQASHVPNIIVVAPPAVLGLLCIAAALFLSGGEHRTAKLITGWIVLTLAVLPAIVLALVIF